MSETKKYNIDYSEITFVNLLLFLWQLPQNVIALIICGILNRLPDDWHNDKNGMTLMMVPVKTSFCWSMGQFIFVNPLAKVDTIRHESGHSVQSLFFGPLYLLLVGLPSVILYAFKMLKRKIGKCSEEDLFNWYHSKYPEKWADTLGGAEYKNDNG